MALHFACGGVFGSGDETKGKDDGDDKGIVSFTVQPPSTTTSIALKDGSTQPTSQYKINLYDIQSNYKEFANFYDNITEMWIYGDGTRDVISHLTDGSVTEDSTATFLKKFTNLRSIKIYCPVLSVGKSVFRDLDCVIFFYGGLGSADKNAFYNFTGDLYAGKYSSYIGENSKTITDYSDEQDGGSSVSVQVNTCVHLQDWSEMSLEYKAASFENANCRICGTLFHHKIATLETCAFKHSLINFFTQISITYSNGTTAKLTTDIQWDGIMTIAAENIGDDALLNVTFGQGGKNSSASDYDEIKIQLLNTVKSLGNRALAITNRTLKFYIPNSIEVFGKGCLRPNFDGYDKQFELYQTDAQDNFTNNRFTLDLTKIRILGDRCFELCIFNLLNTNGVIEFTKLEHMGTDIFLDAATDFTPFKSFIFNNTNQLTLQADSFIDFVNVRNIDFKNDNIILPQNGKVFAYGGGNDINNANDWFNLSLPPSMLLNKDNINKIQVLFIEDRYLYIQIPKIFQNLIFHQQDKINEQTQAAITLEGIEHISNLQINSPVIFSSGKEYNLNGINIGYMTFNSWDTWKTTWKYCTAYHQTNETISPSIDVEGIPYITGTMSYRQCPADLPGSSIIYKIGDMYLSKTNEDNQIFSISQIGNFSVPFVQTNYQNLILDYDIQDKASNYIAYVPWPVSGNNVYFDYNYRWRAKQIILHNLEDNVSIFQNRPIYADGTLMNNPNNTHWLTLFNAENVNISNPFVIKISNNFKTSLPTGALTNLCYSNFTDNMPSPQTLNYDTVNQKPTVYLLLPNGITAVERGALGEIDVTIRDSNFDTSTGQGDYWNTQNLIYWDADNNDNISSHLLLSYIEQENRFIDTDGFLYFRTKEGANRVLLKDCREAPKDLDLSTRNKLIIAEGAFVYNTIRELKLAWLGASLGVGDSDYKRRQLKYIFKENEISKPNKDYEYTLYIKQNKKIISPNTAPALENFYTFELIQLDCGSDNTEDLGVGSCLFAQGPNNNVTIKEIKFTNCPVPKYLFNAIKDFTINTSNDINIILQGQNCKILPTQCFQALSKINNLQLSNGLTKIEDCFNRENTDIKCVKYPLSLATWGTTIEMTSTSTNPMTFCRQFLVESDNKQCEYITGFTEDSEIKPHAYSGNYFINSADLTNVKKVSDTSFKNNYALYEIYNVTPDVYIQLDTISKDKVVTKTSTSRIWAIGE